MVNRSYSGRVTIRDVAAHAGVSVSAVSKVLRGAYGVSARMKQRVEASVEALGFRPMASARGMRGRTFTVGALAVDIANPFTSVLIDGIQAELAKSGVELLIGAGGLKRGSQQRTIDAMLDHRVDGLLLIAPVLGESALVEIGRRAPLVTIGRHGHGSTYDAVAGDDMLGADLVVDHLAGYGHERIAFVVNDDGGAGGRRSPHAVRRSGYLASMGARDLEPDLIVAHWTAEGGIQAARALLDRDELPTAVFAGADVAAFGILDALWLNGERHEPRIAIAGYDNTPTSALQSVSLTTVDQSGAQMGAAGARMLLERIGGRTEPRSELTKPHLIVRRTTTLTHTPMAGSAVDIPAGENEIAH